MIFLSASAGILRCLPFFVSLPEDKTTYAMNNGKAGSRIFSIDVVRFIMSFAVIALHVWSGLYPNEVQYPAVSCVLLVAVPFFFASSGYLTAQRMEDMTDYEARYYLRRKAWRFLRMFGCWILLYLPFSILTFFREDLSLSTFLYRYLGMVLLYGESYWAFPLWYLWASFWAYMLLNLPEKMRKRLPMLFVTFLAIIIIHDVYPYFVHNETLDRMLYGLTYRVLGGGAYIIAGMYVYKYRKYANWLAAGILIALYVAIFAFAWPTFSVLIGGVGLLVASLNVHLSYSPVYKLLNLQSIWIFFSHMMVIGTLHFWFSEEIATIKPVTAYLMVCAITYLLSCVLVYLSGSVRCTRFLQKLIS